MPAEVELGDGAGRSDAANGVPRLREPQRPVGTGADVDHVPGKTGVELVDSREARVVGARRRCSFGEPEIAVWAEGDVFNAGASPRGDDRRLRLGCENGRVAPGQRIDPTDPADACFSEVEQVARAADDVERNAA